MAVLESKFQAELIEDLRALFPGCIILKNDANYLQGFPDLLILFENKWAALEVKANAKSKHQPNQDYYVDRLERMSFATFVYPENREAVLVELQSALQSRRKARVS